MTDLDYLNELYGSSEDPWHMRSGWQPQRKRELILASLPSSRFTNAFEPGCSHGELTTELASRTERLLAVDSFRDAVTDARNRTSHLSNVTVEFRHLPTEWPSNERFDLIVLNEIGSMSSAADWSATVEAIKGSLADDATVVACHWRHRFPGRTITATSLHEVLETTLRLPEQTHIVDADFIIVVWTTRPRSSPPGQIPI
jgi:hypothetical protein